MTAQRLVTVVIALAMVTTLILPGRATPAAINAGAALIANPLKIIMGN